MRYAFGGGATVPPDLVRQVEAAVGVSMGIIDAQTEASPGITMTRPFDDDPADRAETLGRPLPAIDGEGWLHTGDLAGMDDRGYCRIEGRLKEMIIRGGENIFPREIEYVLLAHPGIEDVAVQKFALRAQLLSERPS